MAREQGRLDKEYEKRVEEIKREMEKEKEKEAKQEETEENNETNENEEEKQEKKKDKKKIQMPKKPEVPYPFSVHGDDRIPAVEYKNTQVWVRSSGGVSLFQRFPEVLADERNTWVLPEDRERAKDLAARRLQQRLEWREWMKRNHPKILADIDKGKRKGSSASARS